MSQYFCFANKWQHSITIQVEKHTLSLPQSKTTIIPFQPSSLIQLFHQESKQLILSFCIKEMPNLKISDKGLTVTFLPDCLIVFEQENAKEETTISQQPSASSQLFYLMDEVVSAKAEIIEQLEAYFGVKLLAAVRGQKIENLIYISEFPTARIQNMIDMESVSAFKQNANCFALLALHQMIDDSQVEFETSYEGMKVYHLSYFNGKLSSTEKNTKTLQQLKVELKPKVEIVQQTKNTATATATVPKPSTSTGFVEERKEEKKVAVKNNKDSLYCYFENSVAKVNLCMTYFETALNRNLIKLNDVSSIKDGTCLFFCEFPTARMMGQFDEAKLHQLKNSGASVVVIALRQAKDDSSFSYEKELYGCKLFYFAYFGDQISSTAQNTKSIEALKSVFNLVPDNSASSGGLVGYFYNWWNSKK